jgi:hypothetical protein
MRKFGFAPGESLPTGEAVFHLVAWQLRGRSSYATKLNREARKDRKEDIFFGLRAYRTRQTMRWIPYLMRKTFQLIRKPMQHPFSLR